MRMCLCFVEFTAGEWKSWVGWVCRWVCCRMDDKSFSRFSKVDCANARYVVLTVYIFAVVHP